MTSANSPTPPSRMLLPFAGVTGRLTQRLAAVVLGFLAPCILFAAVGIRAIARAGEQDGRGTAYLLLFLVLAVLAVAAAGAMRTPYGVTLGWITILATLATTAIHPVMAVVGIIFLILWLVALVQGQKRS